MKVSVIILITAVNALVATAQSTNNSRFSYEKTTEFASQIVDSRIQDLFYNGSESVYVNYSKKSKSLNDTTEIGNLDGGTNTIVNIDNSLGKDNVLYKNYAKNVMILRESLANGKKCIVNDSIPRLKWKLLPETEKIGPYTCQKATTTFRCADYSVWFTMTIPLSIGPWKLGGLPGLIVKAVNHRANVTYLLLSAEYPNTKSTYSIAPPNTGETVYSFAEYTRVQIKELDKLRVFEKAQAAGNGKANDAGSIHKDPECLDGK